MWFPDDSFEDYEYKQLNAGLYEKAYQMIKDCPLRTTEESKRIIAENFGAREEEDLIPAVRKGTALTGDNYWKGMYGHVTANFIADYYGCDDPDIFEPAMQNLLDTGSIVIDGILEGVFSESE